MKTSSTHPIIIAEVQADPAFGKIGITFCPGKIQQRSMSGPWARDLGEDLDAIAGWNAAAVVTLMEQHELETLSVRDLGFEVRKRHMDWFHLPVVDVSTPDARFKQAWSDAGPRLRALLRSGANVLVHCRGGLGRSGLLAACLLVELGWQAEDAIAGVRKVRPGAIETRAQEDYVRATLPVAEDRPPKTPDAVADRAAGALLGLAAGDAVGTTLEFRPRDSYAAITDMVGGGPFSLQAGQWTDDTSMALALADSLLSRGPFDAADLMERFVAWRENGEYSCTGNCFDIGVTTGSALSRWKQTGDPFSGSTDPRAAGNGSLMRLSPVAIRFWRDRQQMACVAAAQSRTTHAAPEAVSACIAYAGLVADAIAGLPRSEVLEPRAGEYNGTIAGIMRGSWRGLARHEIRSSGYVAHSLEAAIWSVARTTDFASAVLMAANLGEDADTTAAIAGQLAGALYGAGGIPAEWLAKLAWRSRIEDKALRLMQM